VSSSFSKPCFDEWIARRSHSAGKKQVGGIACSYQTSIFYAVILLFALNPRSQSALLGDRVSTVTCHKQLVEIIGNAFSNTCLVFNKTKMDFLVIKMKDLT